MNKFPWNDLLLSFYGSWKWTDITFLRTFISNPLLTVKFQSLEMLCLSSVEKSKICPTYLVVCLIYLVSINRNLFHLNYKSLMEIFDFFINFEVRGSETISQLLGSKSSPYSLKDLKGLYWRFLKTLTLREHPYGQNCKSKFRDIWNIYITSLLKKESKSERSQHL